MMPQVRPGLCERLLFHMCWPELSPVLLQRTSSRASRRPVPSCRRQQTARQTWQPIWCSRSAQNLVSCVAALAV